MQRGGDMLKLCSWDIQYNGRLMVYGNTIDDTWKPITPLVVQMIKDGEQVSHGICPDCYKRLEQELDFENRRKETGNDD